jgi:hypothetical protein
MIRSALCLPLLTLALAATGLSAQGPAAPHLEKRGATTELIVEGKPFLMLGGELNNSSLRVWTT